MTVLIVVIVSSAMVAIIVVMTSLLTHVKVFYVMRVVCVWSPKKRHALHPETISVKK